MVGILLEQHPCMECSHLPRLSTKPSTGMLAHVRIFLLCECCTHKVSLLLSIMFYHIYYTCLTLYLMCVKYLLRFQDSPFNQDISDWDVSSATSISSMWVSNFSVWNMWWLSPNFCHGFTLKTTKGSEVQQRLTRTCAPGIITFRALRLWISLQSLQIAQ